MQRDAAYSLVGILVVLPLVGLVFFFGGGTSSAKPDAPTFDEGPYIGACEGLMRDLLSQPATFEERAGEAHPKAGNITSNVWFTASNAFGAIGHYRGMCFIDGKTVKGVIALDTSDEPPWIQAAEAHGH